MTAVSNNLDNPVAESSATLLISENNSLIRRWTRQRRADRIASVVLPALVGVAGIVGWQVSTSGAGANVVIPTFTDFLSAVGHVVTTGTFWHAVWTSESALLVAFGLAVAIGVPLGLFLGQYRIADSLLAGYLDIAVVTPTAVFMPLIIIIFGPTFWARVVVIFIFAFPFVVIPCRSGSATVSGELIGMARSYGGSRRKIWTNILIPGSIPSIFTGLRQGIAHAFTGMFLIELTFLAVGIGYQIELYQDAFDSASIFAVSFIVVVEAALIMSLLQNVQNRLSSRWRGSVR